MKENKCEPCFSNDTSAKVHSLIEAVPDFGFFTTLVIIRNILDYLLSVTKKLQNKDSGIAQSTDLIKSVELAKSNK